MGQAYVSKPCSPLLGEVEVGADALTILLSSREEYSTSVTLMIPSAPPPQKATGNSSMRRRRSHKRRRCIGEGEEEEGEMGSCASLSQQPPPKNLDTEEQQLADVFYSALHLHSTRDPLLQRAARSGRAGAEAVDTEGAGDEGSPSMDDLRKELIDVFEMDEPTMAMIEKEVQTRDAPRVTLHVNIHEAKELKPRTPKETSHPYCIVCVSGSSETFKTRVLTDTLSPTWESRFSMWIPARQDAKFTLEVWHDPQEAGMEQLKNLKDIKGLGRLVRDAAANLQSKEMRNLLGSVTVPLADIKDQSIEGWYNLAKIREEESSQVAHRESFKASKKRGSVRLTLRVSTIAQLNLIGPHWFDAFLNKLIQHHLGYLSSFGNFRRGRSRRSQQTVCSTRNSTKSTKSNAVLISKNCTGRNSSISDSNSPVSSGSSFDNEGLLSFSPPWKGTLSSTKVSLLEHYATTLNFTSPITALSWWKVCSKVCVIERAFLGSLLNTLQSYLSEGRYSCAEIEEIKSSLKLWIEAEVNTLKSLTTCFPASTKVVSYAQLQGIIRNFKAVASNDSTKQLNVFPSESSVSQLISDSLMEFSRLWWESCLKSKGRDSHSASEDQQLVFAVSVASEVYSFLADVCNFYHDVFYREASISFLKLTYILLTMELAARVRPLLHQIYSSSARKNSHALHPIKHSEADRYSLEPGTPVWQLYKKFEIIEKIGENLPDETQQQSGLLNYHHWFLGGIERWMERLFARTKTLMGKDVDKDDFEMNSSRVSPSAVETKSNFKIIKSSWQKLSWPDKMEVERVVRPLLHNLCGLGTHFTRLVIAKLVSKQKEETARDWSFLSAQSCTGLNNIQYLKKEIEAIPEFFELSSSDEGSDYFSVVTKTSSRIDESVSLYMDSVIAKLKPTLFGAVEASCNTGNECHLLQEVLNKELCVLRQRLDDTNFGEFVVKIWNALVIIFSKIVETSSTNHNAEYFKGVFRVLERCWYFFTPTDHTGLEPQMAYTAEYQILEKTLYNLKLPTESLIAKYYKERHEELQRAPAHSCSAVLVVRAFFLKSGKLVINVIMVQNIISLSRKPPDTQVVAKLVPNEWFRSSLNAKTKIQRRNNAPVFEEEFEIVIYPNDPGVRAGFLLFLLKSSHLLRSEVIGEAVLPLEEVPSVDTPEARDIKINYLNMNIPKNRDDYTATKALKFRTWDRRAQLFLQRISLRN